MLDNEDKGSVAAAYQRNSLRPGVIDWSSPFRRDVIRNTLPGKVTDEDREIPSVGAYSFLFDCHRHLFAQNGSLILYPDQACQSRLKPDDFEHLSKIRFDNKLGREKSDQL